MNKKDAAFVDEMDKGFRFWKELACRSKEEIDKLRSEVIEMVSKLEECYSAIKGEWGEDSAEDIIILIRKIRSRHPITMQELNDRLPPEEQEKQKDRLDNAFGFGAK